MVSLGTSAFLLECPACKHEFLVPRRAEGKRIACPHCRKVIVAQAQVERQSDPLVGKVIGGVKLTRRLGAGALGVVYEGQQESLGRRVAIKLLSKKAARFEVQVKRFQREAKLAAQIQHPNVVAVYDHGFDRGVHYLVMEFVEGGTLAQLIEDAERLPWRQAVDVLLQIARALELLASHDMVHRDVKPANILITSEGVAKLADLGLAKQEDPTGEGTMLTMQGMMMGSPAYCSPEQARDASTAGHAADIYSLGATLFHAVTGRPPFQGKSAIETVRMVLSQDVPEPISLAPELPQGINDLILDLMAKHPGDRPQNPSELIGEVTAILEAPQRAARRRVVRDRSGGRAATRRKSGNGPIVIAVLVLGILIAAVVALMLTR
ncbi:MAG: serine/threonine protein kinase [Planctomycetota bacterium]|nr:MAG: serine/threonine protein kinase [Planctomycetota bacterium]